jgi:hypothetical protein
MAMISPATFPKEGLSPEGSPRRGRNREGTGQPLVQAASSTASYEKKGPPAQGFGSMALPVAKMRPSGTVRNSEPGPKQEAKDEWQ